MHIVNTENVPGYKVTKVCGIVFGNSVRSRNFIGNYFGNIRANFGGEQEGYAKMLNDARREAINDIIKNAESMGANCVINLRIDSGQFDSGASESMIEVVAYGTAVNINQE